ncbi:LPXTG cell wall anchor domain-containing protein [Streptomyces fagopyri]|uniref:LPXTG cell wall anchor domain-containing protein n=1 Tax=Streptomyces fagopyri TaxID=2662397 RepID=UPI0037128766
MTRTTVLRAAAAAAVLGLGPAATPASAETSSWSVSCSEVTIDLTGYNLLVINTVEVTDNGKEMGPEYGFRDEYHQTLAIPAHDRAARIHLLVNTGNGSVAVDETKVSPVCGAATPSASSSAAPTGGSATPTPASPSAPSPSASGTPEPDTSGSGSPTSAAPGQAGSSAAPLAETGAAGTSLLVAAAAVGLTAGAALLLTGRRRRSTHR